ncbi:hypothetical protein V8E53_007157, partial [Lactarius tabidus]
LTSLRKAPNICAFKKESRLHVCINNTSAMVSPRDQVTSQKLQFGTNIICYLAIDKTDFTGLFVVTDASSFHDKVHISTASSSANYLTTGIDVDTIADGPERTKYVSRITLLATRSQGNVIVAQELARRYWDKTVSRSLHPGNIHTDLQRRLPRFQDALLRLYLASYGALTQLYYCTTAPPAADASGRFFIPRACPGEPNKGAVHPQVGEKLRSWPDNETKKSWF